MRKLSLLNKIIVPIFLIILLLVIYDKNEKTNKNDSTVLNTISKYCLLFAMAAIGLNTSLKSMVSKGPKVLLVASISFCFQIIFVLYLLS